jgi:hypothetical protein
MTGGGKYTTSEKGMQPLTAKNNGACIKTAYNKTTNVTRGTGHSGFLDHQSGGAT